MRLRISMVLWLLAPGAWARAQVDVSAWPQVRMEVVALEATGEPMAGLTRDALVVKEGRQPHPVDDVQPGMGPQSVCVLIDASGSMYDRLSLVLTKARRFIRTLPAEDEVCLAEFATDSFIDQNLTQDKAAAQAALGHIKASGGTSERDALLALAGYMRKEAKNKSRAIVIFGDADDNSSKTNWQDFVQGMEIAGTPVVHFICLPPAMGNARWKQGDPKAGPATKVSRIGGGLTYFPHNMNDINSIVDNLAGLLQSRYVVTFTAENTTKDGQGQAMQVLFEKTHRSKDAVVLAPEGYYAPSH